MFTLENLDRYKMKEMFEWLVTGMVLIYGIRYIREIVAYVLEELHRIFVQRGIPGF